MSSAADLTHAAAARAPDSASPVADADTAARRRALTPGEIAWIAAIPTALIVLVAIAILGPAVGRTLFPPSGVELWPSTAPSFRPEPVEQGRFLVALTAPLLLTALTVLAVRRAPRLAPGTAGVLVTVAQAAGAAAVVGCVIAQRQLTFGQTYTGDPFVVLRRTYFTLPTLAVAALIAAVVLAIACRPRARARFTSLASETRAKQILALLTAVTATVIWLLHGYSTETSISRADVDTAYHLLFPLGETFSVLDGRSPLVDFVPLYGFLWPYAFAAGMAVLGETVGVYLALASLATGVAMIAVYAALRRVARSSIAALLLFLPFLATSFFIVHGTLVSRFSFGALPGTFPMRFAGPFVLFWLLARHLDGAHPRRPWLLFLVGGLVVLNNPDTGIPALGATIAALLWAGGRPTRGALRRLLIAIVAGLAAAYVLVSILTLARTGSLPDLGLLFFFPRAFAAAGFYLLPMPTVGLHVVLYLTFVAAIGVATVRALAGEHDRTLTGLLAFSGVFGLGAGAYYVGRSHPDSLIAIFPPWALALALLVVVALRALTARPSPRPTFAEIACVFGLAVAACSLAQTPLPWQHIDRIASAGNPMYATPDGQDFVAQQTRRGEDVLILMRLGHRIGTHLGVTNVNPYSGSVAMPLPEQLDNAVAALRETDGRKLFFWADEANPELPDALAELGFAPRASDPSGAFQLWVDTTATR